MATKIRNRILVAEVVARLPARHAHLRGSIQADVNVNEVVPLHSAHSRSYADNRFVYPVLSRRSRGISLGINLNPDKVCNFDCIYCQVNRTSRSESRFVEIEPLLEELRGLLTLTRSGALFENPPFHDVPDRWRRLNDLAFSGDGEPTTYRNFDTIVARCAEIKQSLAGHDVKMVLITNASMFHRPHVQRGLAILDQNQGEIWAKLDAGTAEYFQLVDRTTVPFERVMQNITEAARVRPLVIQALFMRVHGAPPPDAEIDAFCHRLLEVQRAGGELRYVQVYTVARPPAESYVAPLSDAEVDAIRDRVQQLTGLEAHSYYGSVNDV